MQNGGLNDLTEDTSEGTPRNSAVVRVKLSAAENSRAYPLISYEWNTLLENCTFYRCKKHNEPLSDIAIRPAVQTFYEEPIVESEFLVEPDPQDDDKPKSLLETGMRLSRYWCREMGHGLHDQPRLEILTPECWCLSCDQTHRNIRLSGFELGNLHNYGLFMSHYLLDMTDPMPSQSNMLHKGEMDLLLEHDCKKMMIRFTLGEYNVERQDRIWHLYRMTLDYSSIHSVAVDFADVAMHPKDIRDGQHPISHVALYLIIKYPPKVVVDVPRQNLRQNQASIMRGSRDINQYGRRTHNFYRTANVLNWGTKFSRSSVIKLLYPVIGDVEHRRLCMSEFWNILSRLKARAKIHVYFMAIRTYQPQFNEISDDVVSPELFTTFGCYYLVKALMSRGYAVLDQIDPKFITLIANASIVNAAATEKALEQLLCAVDERRFVSLTIAFEKLYKTYAVSSSDIVTQTQALAIGGGEFELDVPRNCVRVRKLIVTPTRLMLMAPEVMMGNRVIRKFGEEYCLRILFRDEDGLKLRADRMQEDLFREMVDNLLKNGYKIGTRHYRFLAWSNSQLRDHGCYMYATTNDGKSVDEIRCWMGDFTASVNVPKMMSRMGQCFTQAQEAVIIPYAENSPLVRIENDVTSNAKDPNGEPYVFSDGIGCLSEALARKVAEQLHLDQPVPSAFQIRYAGCKGMLSIDKRLDKNPEGHQLVLRDSMKKFSSDQSWALEIVKYSQPSPVTLNRPLIMILDQVSRRQNCGVRVCNEIHKLLEQQLFRMADMLLSEDVSVDALVNNTPLKIDYKQLRQSGFNLTDEPFFRGMLLAVHKYAIKAQLFKAKIEVPLNQGRTMYGVLDELNVLQYGQVFVQYSENKNKPGENTKVLTGKVMVTKNPCLVPGDVRLFEAINRDALKHLVDVIVFPRNGPRPHTDEMAGSDLDGDEYAVYWNPNLRFVKNEPAMHFPKVKPPQIQGGVKDTDMIDFFIKYVRQDSIGRVASAHLVMADLSSIYNPLCMEIAKKCSAAVDFPKTGVPADPLTEDEIPRLYPDYMQKEHQRMYKSRRLLGQIYRKIKMVSDTVEVGQVDLLNQETFDADLEVTGWQEYQDGAIAARNKVTHFLQALLDQYGVQDESQLVSGRMVTVRNRISDTEREDFSFYNTESMIELRIHDVFARVRREFFDEFGGEREELLESPSMSIQKKASAYYMVTYNPEVASQGERSVRMLSFPWLVWEVLACIKRHKVYERGVESEFVEPVHARLSKAIEQIANDSASEEDRIRLISTVLERAPVLVTVFTVYRVDFANILYVILRWCEKERAFTLRRRLQMEHVALLLVRFASGQSGFTNKVGDAVQYILPIDELKRLVEQQPNSQGPLKRMYRPGSLCLDFVKYLASEYFRSLTTIDFVEFDLNAVFESREWHFLNSVALKTYHHVAWTSSFKSLHLIDPADVNRTSSLRWDREELDPIPIKLDVSHMATPGSGASFNPLRVLVDFSKLLKQWSGMEEIQMRRDLDRGDYDQYLVVGVGSLEARNKLKDLLLRSDLEECLMKGESPPTLLDE